MFFFVTCYRLSNVYFVVSISKSLTQNLLFLSLWSVTLYMCSILLFCVSPDPGISKLSFPLAANLCICVSSQMLSVVFTIYFNIWTSRILLTGSIFVFLMTLWMNSDYFAAQANRIFSTFENASLSCSVRLKIIRLNTTLIKCCRGLFHSRGLVCISSHTFFNYKKNL